jgi:RHS repeat-associated protein
MKSTTKFLGFIFVCVAMGAALAEPPAVKVLTADLMSPSAANSWYPTGLTNTPKLCSLIPTHVICTGGRPAHIRELARTLGAGRLTQAAYTSRVFEYVYANIDTEFRYGLSKGALGALLDQSGTPFDQAMLMVELLKEANVNAGYRAGTIELDGTQFAAWTGITNATAACRLLADGGIPAEINLSTTANCSYGSNVVSKVVMSHVWVYTNSKIFDPSYKAYTFKAPPSLDTITTCGSTTTCATTIRTTAIPSGAQFQGNETIGTKSVAYVQRVATDALNTKLSTLGTKLEQYMSGDLTRVAWEVEDVAGGRYVNVGAIPQPPQTVNDPDPRAPLKPIEQRVWDNGIPDAYRTRFRIQAGTSAEIDQWLFADEMEGYWLTIAGGTVSQSVATSSRYMELHLWGPTFDAPTNTVILQKSNVTASYTTALLTLSVDHPYYGASTSGGTLGTYMDEVAGQTNSLMTTQNQGAAGTVYVFIPTYIATAWGRTGDGHFSWVSKNAANVYVDQLHYAQWPCDGTKVGDAAGIFCDRVLDGALPSNFASWMAQATDAIKLVDGINNSRSEHHHTFGIFAQLGNSTFIDARSAVSVASVANVAGDRQSAVASQVAMLGLLEGISGAQQNDSWGVMSSIGLFGLANEKAVAAAAGAKTHRFYDTNSGNVTQVLGAVTGYSAGDKSFVQSYVNTGANYSAILSRNGSIGSYTWGSWTTQFLTTPIFAYSSDGTRVAYVSTGRNKGAGSGSATHDAAVQALKLADPKNKGGVQYSVGLFGGELSLNPAPDIVTGQGGFPYSLPFVRTYNSSTRDPWEGYWLPDGQGFGVMFPILDPSHALSNGWRHNYEIGARIASDGFQALGSDSGLDASAAVTALYAMRSLNVGTQSFQNRIASIFVMDWLGKQMVDNAVVVDRPPMTSSYVRLPSGMYNPPPGSSEILRRTGARTRAIAGYTNFDYSGISLSLTDANGGVLSFSTSDYDGDDLYLNSKLVKNKFRTDSWVFPEGVRLDFAYQKVPLAAGSQTLDRERYYLWAVYNNLGRKLEFGGGQDGNYDLTITDENNRTATIYQLGGGAKDSAGTEVLYHYSAPSLLSDVTLPSLNKALSAGYDSLGRVQYIEDGALRRTNYFPAKVSNERFSRGESLDALGGQVSIFFNEAGGPLQSIDAVGRYSTYQYDGIGRLVKAMSPERNGTDFTYDVRGNRLTQTVRPKSGSGGLTTTTAYFTSPTTWQCPASDSKRCNKIVSVDGPRTDVSDLRSFTYDQGTGQELTSDGPAVTGGSPSTAYGYQVVSAANTPSGTSTAISLIDTKTERIDASRNSVTKFGYAALANHLALNSVTVDYGGFNLQTQFGYDSVGNLRSIIDPRGKISNYCVDSGRRIVRVTIQVGALEADCATIPTPTGDDIVAFQDYNGDGQVSHQRSKDSDFAVWRDISYTYMPSGELATETDAEGNATRYEYDEVGRLAMTTDAAGRKSRTFYYPDGKARKIINGYQYPASSSDESCSVPGTDQQCYVQFTYAPIGGKASDYNGSSAYTVTDAVGNISTNTFDAFDRADRTTYPDGTFLQVVSYDDAGNILQMRNRAGEIIVRDYDALNREWHKTNSTMPTVAYDYDLMSHATGATQTGGQTVTWHYDTALRMDSTTAGGRTLRYQYDNSGNRREIMWPDGFFVEYKFDDANRMWQVWENDSQKLAEYSYNTLSERTNFARGNGDDTTYKYEADGDLWKLSHVGLPSVPIFTIGRNAAHQINNLGISDDGLSWKPVNGTASYVPNNLNQYDTVNGIKLSYDTKGNLTGDPKGNLSGDGPATYTYDAENELTSATQNAIKTTYAYDGIGRRIAKQVGVGGAITEFLLDNNEEVAEYSGSTLLRRYVYGPSIDERILMYSGSGTSASAKNYYYSDQQKSTVAVADGNGVVSETATYSPFGESSNTTGNPFKFSGRRYDPESGLYFFRARYYSPKLGRFLQTDPVGYKEDLGLYSFVGGDPLNRADPSGKESPCFSLPHGCGDPPPTPKWMRDMGNDVADGLDWINYEILIPLGPEGPQQLGVMFESLGMALRTVEAVRAAPVASAAEMVALADTVPVARGPAATLELANEVLAAGGKSPWHQAVSVLETAEGPTLVGAGADDLTAAQKAFAESKGLTVVEDFADIHAEGTVINGAGKLNLRPTQGVVTNAVCGDICQPMIESLGGIVNGNYFRFPQ